MINGKFGQAQLPHVADRLKHAVWLGQILDRACQGVDERIALHSAANRSVGLQATGEQSAALVRELRPCLREQVGEKLGGQQKAK
jgi:hypothetical protein